MKGILEEKKATLETTEKMEEVMDRLSECLKDYDDILDEHKEEEKAIENYEKMEQIEVYENLREAQDEEEDEYDDLSLHQF